MFLAMSTSGTMFFFVGVTTIGLVWVYFFLPELANKSLESVDAVFNLPWHQIGRRGKELTQGIGGVAENYGADKVKMDVVEKCSRRGGFERPRPAFRGKHDTQ
jgi:hypothetical protein